MFQKIAKHRAKHRANDASNDVHRPPLVRHRVLGCLDAALLPPVVTLKSAVHWTK